MRKEKIRECMKQEQAGHTEANWHEAGETKFRALEEKSLQVFTDEQILSDADNEDVLTSKVGDEADELKLSCI